MTDKNAIDFFEGIPTSLGIEDGFMQEPNQEITVYEGICTFKTIDCEITGNIRMYWDWFPRIGLRFAGNWVGTHVDMHKISNSDCKLTAGGFVDIKVYITNISTNQQIEGALVESVVEGDKTINVSKIRFELPNMRHFLGDNIRIENSAYRGRLVFEDKDYAITIDAKRNISKLKNTLSSKGGFISTYIGELRSIKGDISYKEATDILECFSKFISFIDGRRYSPIFRQGITNDSISWTDYTNYFNDPYKYCDSWVNEHHPHEMISLWSNFSSLWKEEESFLGSVLHWYVEANNNSGFTDGAIMMAQAGLEQLFNWLVLDKKKLIRGGDVDSMSTPNKLRIMLSLLNRNSEIPHAFDSLKQFFASEKDIDGPDAFVRIRNGIVHSKKQLQEKLLTSEGNVRAQALRLAVHYIELTLLYILKYEGQYVNRCSGIKWLGEGLEVVPWVMKHEPNKQSI